MTTHPWANQGGEAVGLTNRGGDLVVTASRWDCNGTLTVTVRDDKTGGQADPIEAMRRLARRALSHPGKTRSCKLISTRHERGAHYATFLVSRIDT